MKQLVSNNRGMTVTSLIISTGISAAVMAAFAQFMWLQSLNSQKVRQKVAAFETEILLQRMVGSTRSCSCMFGNADYPGARTYVAPKINVASIIA